MKRAKDTAIRLINTLDAVRRLGVDNVARVALHRLKKRLRIYRVGVLPARAAAGSLLVRIGGVGAAIPFSAHPAVRQGGASRSRDFGAVVLSESGEPDWFVNPLNGARVGGVEGHWSMLADFDPGFGDIKTIWEPSRMQWLVDSARAHATGDGGQALERSIRWLEDWSRRNPPPLGPNWMCGQETALRLMHVLLAVELLGGQVTPQPSFILWVEQHLRRIAQTHGYAIGQSNNHWSSEAAGMLIGGAWLSRQDPSNRVARAAMRRGRRSLERAVTKLVLPDGTFSQYSTNYHRVLLDTLSITEVLRSRFDLQPFSTRLHAAVRSAVNWLAELTDEQTGLAPNLGANDGAHLFVLHDLEPKDMRPSVQLGSVVFCGRRRYDEGPWDEPLQLLGLPDPGGVLVASMQAKPVTVFSDGGIVSIHPPGAGGLRAFVRFPRFRFRPQQSDSMHVDVWHEGVNIFGDSGTYSYAASPELVRSFTGPEGHNTVQFDGREQMPRIGRFLYARWLHSNRAALSATVDGESSVVRWSGAYRDAWGAVHERSVTAASDYLMVDDRFFGHEQQAVLRWRTQLPVRALDRNSFDIGPVRLRLEGVGVPEVKTTVGLSSERYLEKHDVCVLECTFGPGEHRVRTMIQVGSASGGN